MFFISDGTTVCSASCLYNFQRARVKLCLTPVYHSCVVGGGDYGDVVVEVVVVVVVEEVVVMLEVVVEKVGVGVWKV